MEQKVVVTSLGLVHHSMHLVYFILCLTYVCEAVDSSMFSKTLSKKAQLNKYQIFKT